MNLSNNNPHERQGKQPEDMRSTFRRFLDRDLERDGEVLPVYEDSPEEAEEWRQEVAREPWVAALKDLVGHSDTWTGTETQVIEELKRRVDREVGDSENFPADLRTLMGYQRIASRPLAEMQLFVFDYRKVKKEGDLEEFDVLGWGPRAPILVEQGFAGRRPSYHSELFDFFYVNKGLLLDPLALAILRFTYHDTYKFTQKRRKWSGRTKELAKWLQAYYPRDDADNYPPDPVQAAVEEMFDRYDETWKILQLWSPAHYRQLHERMKVCAPAVEKAGVKVSWKKVPSTWTTPEGVRKPTKRTYWSIEAPYWLVSKPRRLIATP